MINIIFKLSMLHIETFDILPKLSKDMSHTYLQNFTPQATSGKK